MKEKFLQTIADYIYNRLSEAESEDAIEFYYDLGIWIDGIALNTFNIELK